MGGRGGSGNGGGGARGIGPGPLNRTPHCRACSLPRCRISSPRLALMRTRDKWPSPASPLLQSPRHSVYFVIVEPLTALHATWHAPPLRPRLRDFAPSAMPVDCRLDAPFLDLGGWQMLSNPAHAALWIEPALVFRDIALRWFIRIARLLRIGLSGSIRWSVGFAFRPSTKAEVCRRRSNPRTCSVVDRRCSAATVTNGSPIVATSRISRPVCSVRIAPCLRDGERIEGGCGRIGSDLPVTNPVKARP
jgi:hypothetical protein